MPLTPGIRAFLDDLQALVDQKAWPALARDRLSSTFAETAALVVLPHAVDPDRLLELTVYDSEVVVTYGPEHVAFGRPDEALRFVEMLGDGRVELVVRRTPGWTSMRSYRDGLALPFRKTSGPWPNVRPRTERLGFGFTR